MKYVTFIIICVLPLTLAAQTKHKKSKANIKDGSYYHPANYFGFDNTDSSAANKGGSNNTNIPPAVNNAAVTNMPITAPQKETDNTEKIIVIRKKTPENKEKEVIAQKTVHEKTHKKGEETHEKKPAYARKTLPAQQEQHNEDKATQTGNAPANMSEPTPANYQPPIAQHSPVEQQENTVTKKKHAIVFSYDDSTSK